MNGRLEVSKPKLSMFDSQLLLGLVFGTLLSFDACSCNSTARDGFHLRRRHHAGTFLQGSGSKIRSLDSVAIINPFPWCAEWESRDDIDCRRCLCGSCADLQVSWSNLCRCFEVVFGLVFSLQYLVPVVDVYADYYDHFRGAGAPEFLQSLGARPVREFSVFWERWASYQLVIWADHNGWEFQERRARGPRGELLQLIKAHMACSATEVN